MGAEDAAGGVLQERYSGREGVRDAEGSMRLGVWLVCWWAGCWGRGLSGAQGYGPVAEFQAVPPVAAANGLPVLPAAEQARLDGDVDGD